MIGLHQLLLTARKDMHLNKENDPRSDIFDSTSIEPPLHTSDSAQNTNDEGTPVNFSRKRMHHRQTSTVDDTEPSKRPRHTGRPLSTIDLNKKMKTTAESNHVSPPQPQVSSPPRASKFFEASMHDRPSEKPPSMFTRLHIHSPPSTDMEALMDDYTTLSSSPTKLSTTMQTQLKGLTHHPNMSITSSATIQTNDTSLTKRSSIFRFGRSMASSFNPLNIWNSLSNGWTQAKDQLEEEAKDTRQKEWDERKAKAEQMYAEFKKANPPTITKAVKRGREVEDETPRPSVDSAPVIPIPTGPASIGQSGRKPSFHFRTPSLSSLKKIASEVNLHKRSVSLSKSPEKQAAVESTVVQSTVSKKDVDRQIRLTKRVSDLEVKLEKARKELQEAMGTAPPVPPIPQKHTQGPSPLSSNRPVSRHIKKFEPLPSLPSERLLCADPARQSNVPDIAEQYFAAEAKTDAPPAAGEAQPEPENTKYAFAVKAAAKEPANSAPTEPPSDPQPSSPARSPPAKPAAAPTTAKLSKRRKVAADGLPADAPAPATEAVPLRRSSRNLAAAAAAERPLPALPASPQDEPSSPRRHVRHRHARSLSPAKPAASPSAAAYRARDAPRRDAALPHADATAGAARLERERDRTRRALRRKGPVVAVRPNGRDVPPLPRAEGRRAAGEEWVWPDDVF